MLPGVERFAEPARVDRLDAGLAVRAVGDDADLRAGEADRLLAEFVDGHGDQRDGDLLAGGQEHVHLAGGRAGGDLGGLGDEVVGGAPWAETTTMTWLPACLARIGLARGLHHRSASLRLDPPNFCTTTPTANSSGC